MSVSDLPFDVETITTYDLQSVRKKKVGRWVRRERKGYGEGARRERERERREKKGMEEEDEDVFAKTMRRALC